LPYPTLFRSEKDERADHAPFRIRQHAPDLEPAEIAAARFDDELDRAVAHARSSCRAAMIAKALRCGARGSASIRVSAFLGLGLLGILGLLRLLGRSVLESRHRAFQPHREQQDATRHPIPFAPARAIA